VIDTENGRALHKADDYTFKHAELGEPFSPSVTPKREGRRRRRASR
jgi:hypothetical protein